MIELRRDVVTGHTVVQSRGRTMTLHRDLKIDHEVIDWIRVLMDYTHAESQARRDAAIADYERLTGCSLQ